MKTRLRPRFRSYVWRDRPTDVVIWKVVFPKGIEVKGTLVGETNPTVYLEGISAYLGHWSHNGHEHTRKGAKMRDAFGDEGDTDFEGAPTFWRLIKGPSFCLE